MFIHQNTMLIWYALQILTYTKRRKKIYIEIMIYITDSITSLQVHGLQVQAMTWFFLKLTWYTP